MKFRKTNNVGVCSRHFGSKSRVAWRWWRFFSKDMPDIIIIVKNEVSIAFLPCRFNHNEGSPSRCTYSWNYSNSLQTSRVVLYRIIFHKCNYFRRLICWNRSIRFVIIFVRDFWFARFSSETQPINQCFQNVIHYKNIELSFL